MFEGRSVQAKKQLIGSFFATDLGISATDLEITIFETQSSPPTARLNLGRSATEQREHWRGFSDRDCTGSATMRS